MQPFIHHLDTISYESESLERHRERLVMEAVGGDAKHNTGYSGRYIKYLRDIRPPSLWSGPPGAVGTGRGGQIHMVYSNLLPNE